MIYKSASTTLLDSFRAGIEIGESLKEIAPEVILLFSSIILEDNYADFIAGLYDGLENNQTIIFGGTGDGIYEASITAHYGVCALGMSSDGSVTWSATVVTGVGADSSDAARRCATAALESHNGIADWAFILADGITADGTGIVSGLRENISFPFVGGLTGDDRKFKCGQIFINDKVIDDGVAILMASGGIPFMSHSISGFKPIGVSGTVEEVHGKTIKRISEQTPMAFIREQTGKTLAEADLGILALANETGPCQNQFFLRVMFGFDNCCGSITCFGSVPNGTTLRVSKANRADLLSAVTECIEKLRNTGFKPAAAIVISCVGRKWLLNTCGQEEVQAIQNVLGNHLPLIGFPSFGEIGAFLNDDNSYTETYFHNATCVLCLLGA